jgi:hypothetical protein
MKEISRSKVDHRGDPIVGPLLTACVDCGESFELQPIGLSTHTCKCGRVHQLVAVRHFEYVVREAT